MKTLIVVDAQNDFIDGSLACQNTESALENIVKFLNDGKAQKSVYSADWHSRNNKSFKRNGGIWPDHCVENTKGAELSSEFDKIKDENLKPNENNIYKKGIDDEVEEYSAYLAKDKNGKAICDLESDEFIVCGFASEYCVRETILELKKNGKNVSVFLDGIGYVDEADHKKNIKELKDMGIKFI
jgi:nicotinamidase/pyrazinamidase